MWKLMWKHSSGGATGLMCLRKLMFEVQFQCWLFSELSRSLVVLGTGTGTWFVLKYNFRVLVLVLVLVKVLVAKTVIFCCNWHDLASVLETLSVMSKFHHMALFGGFAFHKFLPARRYASAGNTGSDRNVSVRPSVCLSRAGIVSKRRKLATWFLHHLVAPRL